MPRAGAAVPEAASLHLQRVGEQALLHGGDGGEGGHAAERLGVPPDAAVQQLGDEVERLHNLVQLRHVQPAAVRDAQDAAHLQARAGRGAGKRLGGGRRRSGRPVRSGRARPHRRDRVRRRPAAWLAARSGTGGPPARAPASVPPSLGLAGPSPGPGLATHRPPTQCVSSSSERTPRFSWSVTLSSWSLVCSGASLKSLTAHLMYLKKPGGEGGAGGRGAHGGGCAGRVGHRRLAAGP